jgi:hypothetical protein
MKFKLKKIKNIRNYNYVGKVYDIKVENDSSYNINDIIVHNSDFCMSGGVFNKALESCADTFLDDVKINQYSGQVDIKNNKVKKIFRGMSTKDAQKNMGNVYLKTSEGVVKTNDVEYTISGWVENFESYLKSAMSYTNKKTLKEFIGNVKYIFITNNAFKRFNK